MPTSIFPETALEILERLEKLEKRIANPDVSIAFRSTERNIPASTLVHLKPDKVVQDKSKHLEIPGEGWYTVPETGFYLVIGSATFVENEVAKPLENSLISIFTSKGLAQIGRGSQVELHTGATTCVVSDLLFLEAGERVSIDLFSKNECKLFIGTGTETNYFGVYRLQNLEGVEGKTGKTGPEGKTGSEGKEGPEGKPGKPATGLQYKIEPAGAAKNPGVGKANFNSAEASKVTEFFVSSTDNLGANLKEYFNKRSPAGSHFMTFVDPTGKNYVYFKTTGKIEEEAGVWFKFTGVTILASEGFPLSEICNFEDAVILPAGQGLTLATGEYFIANEAIKEKLIHTNTIETRCYKHESINNEALGAGCVTSGKVAENAIETLNLSAECVTAPKIAKEAVEPEKIKLGGLNALESREPNKEIEVLGNVTTVYLNIHTKEELTEFNIIADGKTIFKSGSFAAGLVTPPFMITFRIKGKAKYKIEVIKGTLASIESAHQEG